jgi:hypothetical protein
VCKRINVFTVLLLILRNKIIDSPPTHGERLNRHAYRPRFAKALRSGVLER